MTCILDDSMVMVLQSVKGATHEFLEILKSAYCATAFKAYNVEIPSIYRSIY
jgi:hypothetical protein